MIFPIRVDLLLLVLWLCYERGKPKRNHYRKFKIKSVQGPNDYASMEEVLTRRFSHGLKEQEEGKELGSLLCISGSGSLWSGGRGQVNVAERVLESLHLQIPVVEWSRMTSIEQEVCITKMRKFQSNERVKDLS